MSLDEPTMIGDTPEDRMRAQQRRKRLRIVAAVVFVIVAVGIGIALLPTTPNTNIVVDPTNSRCSAGGSFSCTVVLDPKQGVSLTASMVKAVQINGTSATTTVRPSGNSITVIASVPLVPMQHCPPDIGCSLRPPTTGDVVVFLTDGTTVSVVLGAGGIVK